jgi:hypothetical protein
MRHSLLAVVVALMLPSVAAGNEMAENASCMGLGASFYGQFAPQQMAFVVAFVNESAATAGTPPGATYSFFAQEKEGGAIPAPCGTRLE